MSFYEVQTFSPPLLNNSFGLKKFLSGKNAISSIRAQCNKKTRPSNLTYFNSWIVAWIIIKSPIDIFLSLFFKALSFIADALQFQKGTQVFSLISNHFLRDWDQLSDQWDMEIPMLMPAYRNHQLSNWDIYLQLPIPIESIDDDQILPLTYRNSKIEEKIRHILRDFYKKIEEDHLLQTTRIGRVWERLTSSNDQMKNPKKITDTFVNYYKKSPDVAFKYLQERYSQPYAKKAIERLYEQSKKLELFLLENYKDIPVFFGKGACRGACLWFIYLYLHTQYQNVNVEKHAMSVASQFKTGIPRQAAILNGLHRSEELLNLKMTSMEDQYISLFEMDNDRRDILRKIDSLHAGIYRVGTYHHSFVFIKNSNKDSYVWNPDFGLFKMDSEQMFQMILKYHYRSKKPGSHIYFHRYEMM